jgi:hypothetical protein
MKTDIFFIILHSILLRMRNVSDKVVEKINTFDPEYHFLLENRDVYEIIREIIL